MKEGARVTVKTNCWLRTLRPRPVLAEQRDTESLGRAWTISPRPSNNRLIGR
jgi:hypothetical protein